MTLLQTMHSMPGLDVPRSGLAARGALTVACAHGRRRAPRVLLAFALTLAAACGKETSEERAREESRATVSATVRLQPAGTEIVVVLDSDALMRAGIRTEVLRAHAALPLTASTAGASTASQAMTGELVADPGGVTTIRAGIPGRLTRAGAHWPALGERIAGGTAVAQVSDARALSAPRGGVVIRVSAQPGEIVQAGQELLQLADFSELLARIVWRSDAPPPPRTLRISPLTSTASDVVGPTVRWTARLVGPAAEVDSVTRSPVYLYRVRAGPGLRPGLPVTTVADEDRASAGVGTATVAGELVVPRNAVVQWEGLAWVFVERASGRFVRVRLDTARPVSGGWVAVAAPPRTPGALAAGDAVVVRGAQQLLSAEFQSRIPQAEEERK